jgi:peptidoglycan/xylan/chitin deacetylase (PgdA/CDA1 family)
MPYAWSPLPSRRPLKFPNGKRLAVIITVNAEYWDAVKPYKEHYYAGGPPVIPDPLPGDVFDSPNFSWREYGQRVGVWRCFDAAAQAGIPLSVTFNAKTMVERPEIVEACKRHGFEMVAHNYEQGELLTRYAFDEAKEREIVLNTLRTYEKAAGRRAQGWLSSSLRSNLRTPEICAEQGLIFFCDYMNDDQPYLIQTKHGPIVNTPYSVEVNDFTIFHRRGLTTDEGLAMLKEQFDVLYAEGAQSGRTLNFGTHPHVLGHPFRIRALRDFIAHAKKHDGVWWCTREELARWYLEHHKEHIS